MSRGAAYLVALRLPCLDLAILAPQRASSTRIALLSSLSDGESREVRGACLALYRPA